MTVLTRLPSPSGHHGACSSRQTFPHMRPRSRPNHGQARCQAAAENVPAGAPASNQTPSADPRIRRGADAGDLVEDDPRYNRVDLSEQHAYVARLALMRNVSRGEARLNLADAAFQIAAEDDATVSHTVVQLPVLSYQQRLAKLAKEAARGTLARLPPDASRHQQVQAVETFLWEQQRFRLPSYGRSNVPADSIVDHPGVWEDARHAYLHEVLIRRVGCSTALAVIYADVMQRLLADGAVDFAIRIDCSDYEALPVSEVLPNITREHAVTADGVLNTCSEDVLLEMLRFLKRAYWPFTWDSSGGPDHAGGFRDAAQSALDGAASAELQAVAAAAAHRLERGIWTSPGAGDLRRAVAAAERAATIFGDRFPIERRDAGVLLFHAGNHAQAKAELAEYVASPAFHDELGRDRRLAQQLLELLGELTAGQSDQQPLSVAAALQASPPEISAARRLALTW